MNRCTLLLVSGILLLSTGCSTMKNANIADEFTRSTKGYIKLLRWHELESALVTYVSVPLQERYREGMTAAEDVKIVDYRVKREECDPVRGEGTVQMELDYYRPPSVTVRTVTDLQKWSYEQIGETGSWRLQTMLPDFR